MHGSDGGSVRSEVAGQRDDDHAKRSSQGFPRPLGGRLAHKARARAQQAGGRGRSPVGHPRCAVQTPTGPWSSLGRRSVVQQQGRVHYLDSLQRSLAEGGVCAGDSRLAPPRRREVQGSSARPAKRAAAAARTPEQTVGRESTSWSQTLTEPRPALNRRKKALPVLGLGLCSTGNRGPPNPAGKGRGGQQGYDLLVVARLCFSPRMRQDFPTDAAPAGGIGSGGQWRRTRDAAESWGLNAEGERGR